MPAVVGVRICAGLNTANGVNVPSPRGLGLLLEEIVNPKTMKGQEAGFFTSRFRPLSASVYLAESAEQKELVSCVATQASNQAMQPTAGPGTGALHVVRTRPLRFARPQASGG